MLETSFWTNACRADLGPHALDLFSVIVPGAVEEEILSPDPSHPNREYSYASLYRYLRVHMAAAPEPEPKPLGISGRGEAAALALAHQLGLAVLVNDRGAIRHARALGVRVVDVPSLVALLHGRGVLSATAAHRKLDAIQSTTSPALVARVRAVIDEAGSTG